MVVPPVSGFLSMLAADSGSSPSNPATHQPAASSARTGRSAYKIRDSRP